MSCIVAHSYVTVVYQTVDKTLLVALVWFVRFGLLWR